MRKYYAIKNGNTNRSLILFNWEDAKTEVKGAKGVIYKKFDSITEADDFLKSLEKEDEVNVLADDSELGLTSKEIIDIYVDGSYNNLDGKYSYGAVVVENGAEIDNFYKSMKDEYSSMRNVSGEVYGAINAMKYALEKNYKKLNLYFDYQGIESWALGTWKRNNNLTKSYHEFYKKISKELSVNFVKVKGHSGDKFNDRADELAKKALDLI